MIWNEVSLKGSFTNYVDKILAFFDHLPPYVDIFYGINVDKKWADGILTGKVQKHPTKIFKEF